MGFKSVKEKGAAVRRFIKTECLATGEGVEHHNKKFILRR